MVFKPSIKQDVFEFQVSGSKKIFKLPLKQFISADLADRMADAALPLQKLLKKHAAGTLTEDELPEPEKLNAMKVMQRELFDKYAPGAYEAASQSEINEVMQEWGRVSNIELGESSASSSS